MTVFDISKDTLRNIKKDYEENGFAPRIMKSGEHFLSLSPSSNNLSISCCSSQVADAEQPLSLRMCAMLCHSSQILLTSRDWHFQAVCQVSPEMLSRYWGRVMEYSMHFNGTPTLQILPSSLTKKDVWKKYTAINTPESIKKVSYVTFVRLWRQLLPFIAITRPMSDLCWTCQQNYQAISKLVLALERDCILSFALL
jgi:hypothetical protein